MTQAATDSTRTAGPAGHAQGARPAGGGVDQIVIKCAGLTKIFRDFWLRNRVKAVDGIDFEVRRGEVFGLLGPNGSGKSTAIKMILGLLHPTSGRIAVFGHHPRDVAIKEQIGYLPEESYLYKFLNARETLEYYARLFHQHRRQRMQRIDMLLEMVGLDKVAHRPVGEYSKGMQRRIGLAQALINDPQLLILDEPTTGLDPIGTRQIKDLITELAERGKTVLLCSHLLADVEDVCDRVAIMYGGKIRQHGTVDELLVRSGMTDIQAANLSADDVQAIEQLLESRGKHIERVEQPRQRLETLFLDIVHSAQSEGLDTSGAGSGGPLAEFLTTGEGEGAEKRDSDRVIEQLVEGSTDEAAAPAPTQAAAEQAPEGAPQPEQPDESEVIEQLVGGGAEAQTPPDAGTADSPAAPRPAQSAASGAPAESTQPTSDTGDDEGARAKPERQAADEEVDASVLESLLGSEQGRSKDEKREGGER